MAEADELSLAEFWKAVAILTVVVAVVATVIVWSGLYNVSAQRQHFDITTWLLEQVRRQSIRAHSTGVGPPPAALDSADMVKLGAVHFELSCAACHGAPGWSGSPVGRAMLPAPPPLDRVAEDWSAPELFWIVHNGQKYTGMPGWIAYERDDEVWPVVAFLERLPDLDAAEYRELSGREDEVDGVSLAPASPTIDLCARCHGAPGEAAPSAFVPFLSAQSEAYLRRSLEEYRTGKRRSGYMELVASPLDDASISRLAAAYASAPPQPAAAPSDGETAADTPHGAEIFSAGIPEQDLPPCVVCHLGANPQFPQLAGQSAAFLSTQLKVFREGTRDTSGYGAIMTKIAERLTDDDIAAVSAYLASLPPGALDTTPEDAP